MVGRAMTAAAKPDDRHPGRDCGRDANGAVFDHDAVLARRIELAGCEQEEIGRRLARATCEALKTCGSKSGNSRVTESA